MPSLTFRERIARIPNPVILTLVVGVIFIMAGIGRGVSYIMAGVLAILLGGVLYYWYKRNGDRFNIKFLDQLSGNRQITERDETDLEVEMRYVNNPGYHPTLDSEIPSDEEDPGSDRLRGGVASHPEGRNAVLMHGPSRDANSFDSRVTPMAPPPYSALDPVAEDPPGPAQTSAPAVSSGEFPSPPSGTPPPLPSPTTAPPSYDSIYPEGANPPPPNTPPNTENPHNSPAV